MDNGALTGLATDVVVFTIRAQRLCVLLVRRTREPFAEHWALPGGTVPADEGLDACARRLLREKTGLHGVYLEQLYSFGSPGRDPRARVVSVSYFAVVPPGCLLSVTDHSSRLAWTAVDALPVMAFDHGEIVSMAHRRLASKLEYSTIALQFMGERFTLSELQSVYETILGEQLDKRNFRKRVRNLPCLEETGEWFRAGNHRPARLFRVTRPSRVDIIK
ncbi:NUDIX domain-containing protein [Aquisalimonas sp.]|uniref:NUDIX hydrolase n=1 Tax=Aquisalimonas sp. TaxID=1872621 RepID=UPI0025C5CA57|nr:NUDIX domain-containing protein [Aquisalimonas sp.]